MANVFQPYEVEWCQIEKGVAQVKTYLFVLLIVTSISCDNQVQDMATFEATVAGVGIDCGLVLVDFEDKDLKRIEEITGSNGGTYHALNLDKKFQIGQILNVRLRKTKGNELFACTTLGPGYPWVTILKADLKK